MTGKLMIQGDDLALILDRRLLAEHGIDENTLVDVSFAGSTMLVTAGVSQTRKESFQRALKETNSEYSETLKRLAE
jgi:hypothetical protein